MSDDEKCPACGRRPWRVSSPVVTGAMAGCLCTHEEKRIGALRQQLAAAVGQAKKAETIINEARRLIERSASIGEDHPAYGFLVMGIPLAKAIADFDKENSQ